MASDTHNLYRTSTTSSSSFQKTVCLQNWWLVKSEKDSQGRRLAVAGYTSREQQAVRLFSSAPILKRYDVFTLETVDGICVVFKGFMDKALTEANGFPAEVIEHFVFGFPPYWEELAEKSEESTKENRTRTSAGTKKAFIQSESAGESNQTSPTDSTKTSENPHGEGWEKNLGEKNNPKVDRTMNSELRSGKRKSSVLILPHDSVVGIEYPESSFHALDNPSVPSTLDGRSVKSGALPNNVLMEHSTPSTLEGNTITPLPSVDTNANIDRSHDRTTENHIVEGFTSPILACRMSKMREPNSMSKASQIRSNVRSFKCLSKQFNRDSIGKIGSLGSTPCSGRVLRSSRAVKRVKKANPQVSTTSPESVSCKRSSSGRLLLPSLEFWRNQIPIYDSDRTITGVVGLHLEQPSRE